LKYKIFNSKKGIGIDDAIPVMVVIFVVAIMFMLFKFSEHSKEKGITDNIQQQKELVQGHDSLMGYLTSITNGMNNADLVAASYLNKDKSAEDSIKTYFSSRLPNINGWRVKIEDSKEKEFLDLKYGFYDKSPLKYQVAESVIPVKNGETLKITLYFAKGNPGAINSPIDRQ